MASRSNQRRGWTGHGAVKAFSTRLSGKQPDSRMSGKQGLAQSLGAGQQPTMMRSISGKSLLEGVDLSLVTDHTPTSAAISAAIISTDRSAAMAWQRRGCRTERPAKNADTRA